VAGVYTLRLTASDGDLSDDDEVQITVRPANQPPVANAGADQTISLPASATLNGIATDDGLPAGSTLSTTWSKVSGPGDVTFANAAALTTGASFSAGGTYVLKLTASDSELTAGDEVVVTVIPQNRAPVVISGQFQTVTLPSTLTLNGDVSDDGLPLSASLAVQWSIVLGPGNVTFNPETAASCTATLSTPGVYVLRLTATDSVLTG
jgi:hypothetical protein